jgi:hypothetical protein
MTRSTAVREAAQHPPAPDPDDDRRDRRRHFPLTLVSGPGAVARNSIGVVLVGGMTIGTLFTLFVVPSVYVLIAKDHRKEKAKREALENTPDAPPLAAPPRRARVRRAVAADRRCQRASAPVGTAARLRLRLDDEEVLEPFAGQIRDVVEGARLFEEV